MVLASLFLIIGPGSQTEPLASAPVEFPGITAEAFAYAPDREAEQISELAGEGERREMIGPGHSGDVRMIMVRGAAGISTVFVPAHPSTRQRPEICRTFVPMAYQSTIRGETAETAAAVRGTLEWCLNRVSPMVVHIPPLPPLPPSS